jgi:hypothetical protein
MALLGECHLTPWPASVLISASGAAEMVLYPLLWALWPLSMCMNLLFLWFRCEPGPLAAVGEHGPTASAYGAQVQRVPLS